MTNSKTYLLLHGAFHGGWVWNQVKKLLEIQDHTVYAPDLPGLGEDKTDKSSVTLDTHANFIIDFIKNNKLSDVILVGHSYAGVLIEHVYPQIKEYLAQVIFVSALVIEDGSSVFDFMPQEKTENYRRKAHTSEDNSINIDYDIAQKVFFEYSTSEEAHLLYNKLVSHPIQTYEDKINAKEFLDSDVEKIYIYTKNDQLVKPDQQQLCINLLGKDKEVYKIDAGHDPMLSHPEIISDVLLNST